jgi:hypothetical protein
MATPLPRFVAQIQQQLPPPSTSVQFWSARSVQFTPAAYTRGISGRSSAPIHTHFNRASAEPCARVGPCILAIVALQLPSLEAIPSASRLTARVRIFGRICQISVPATEHSDHF